jgi:hypothetical protein
MFKFGRKTEPKCVVNKVLRTSSGALCIELDQWFAYTQRDGIPTGWRWVKNRAKAHVFPSADRADLLVRWTSMPDHHNYSIKSI